MIGRIVSSSVIFSGLLFVCACGPVGGGDMIAPAILALEPEVLKFGPDQDSESLLVKNVGGESLTFEVQVSATSGSVEWLKVEPDSGAVSGGGATSLMVSVLNRDSLEPGTYNGTITVIPEGLEPAESQVTLEVGQPILFVEPGDRLDFGTETTELNLTVKNNGAGKLQYTIQPPGTWLSTDAVLQKEITANEPQTIKFVVDRGAVPWYGDKSAEMMISSNGLNDGNHSNTIPLEVRVVIDPACEVDANCTKEGFYCEAPEGEESGECKAKKENGQACSRPGECKGQVCADGVCCDVVCEGQCISCALPESLGTCSPVADGAECSDDLACTDGDQCQGGECVPGDEMDCTGLNSDCSTGSCDEAGGGCISTITPDTCAIDDECYTAEEPHPDVKCQMCLPEKSKVKWSIALGKCHIEDECYAMGDSLGAEGCLVCNPSKPEEESKAEDDTACDDDGNPCTDDVCDDGICTHVNNDENICSDGDDCTLGDACVGGMCEGTTYSCDDGLPCTNDICDGNSGCQNKVKDGFCAVDGECWLVGTPDPDSFGCAMCQPTENNLGFTFVGDGTNCSDGNYCTLGDECQSGGCVGQLKSCDDGIVCTQDKCDPTTGDCGASTMEDWCLIEGKCRVEGDHAAGPDAACLVCTPLESQDEWTPTAENQECDDLSVCSEESKCVQGVCTAVGPLCDDGLACTDDVCGEGNVCEHPVAAGFCLIEGGCVAEGAAKEGSAGCLLCAHDVDSADWSAASVETVCDDGVKCTENDHCSQGICIGEQKQCGDDLLCTDDSCQEETGECENARMDGWCIIDDECRQAGGGPAGKDAWCTKCDPEVNPYEWLPDHQGQTCDDLSDCSAESVCDNGACVVIGNLCDDGNECTVDTCTEELTCQHANADDNVACEGDGIGCTDDVCLAGSCQHPVTAGKCLIDDACYNDGDVPLASICSACDPDFPTQWTAVNQGADCSDGEWCMTDDICIDGVCTGVPRDCGGDQCHVAVCLEDQDKCLVQTEVDGTECDDEDPCSVEDQCLGGECKAVPKDCSSLAGDNDCIQAFCDPGSEPVPGECKTLVAGLGAPCEDGSFCTVADECDENGQCVSGASRDCDVFATCHFGTCDDELDECVDHKKNDNVSCNADEDGCTVSDYCFDGVCTAGPQADCTNQDDQCNTGICESLSEQNYQCVKDPVGQGVGCDDNHYCTVNDVCDGAGTCQGGGAKDCSGLTSIENCAVGQCSEDQNKCYAATAPNGTTCNDSDPCTLADTCVSGQCQGQMDACTERHLNPQQPGVWALGNWMFQRAVNLGNGTIAVVWRSGNHSLHARTVDRDLSVSADYFELTQGASFPHDPDDDCYDEINRLDMAVAPNGNLMVGYTYRWGNIETYYNSGWKWSATVGYSINFGVFDRSLNSVHPWSVLWEGGTPDGIWNVTWQPSCANLPNGGYGYPDDYISVLAYSTNAFGIFNKNHDNHTPTYWPINSSFAYSPTQYNQPFQGTYKRFSAKVLSTNNLAVVWTTPDDFEASKKGRIGDAVYNPSANTMVVDTGYTAQNTADPGQQSYPRASALSNGRYAVAFASNAFSGPGKVYIQVFNSSGVQDGNPILVSSAGVGALIEGPAVFADDGFVMVWAREGNGTTARDIEAAVYDSNKNKVVNNFRLNDITAGSQSYPVPIVDGDEWFVVWNDVHYNNWPNPTTIDYYFKRYTRSGEPVPGAPERRVAENLTGDQDSAQAAATTGGAVMVWESESVDGDLTGVSMRVLDSQGAPTTSEIQVNATSGNVQNQPSVAFSSVADRIGAAWTSYGQVDGSDVYFRLFNANGLPVTDEIMVNQTTVGDQTAPSVATVSGGDFVVTWSGYSNDLDLTDIYARVFSSNGQAVGNEFIINATLAGDQTKPTVLSYGANNANFATAWVKSGGGGTSGIYVRRFNKNGSPGSGEALVAQVSNPDSYSFDRHHASGVGAVCWGKSNAVSCRVLGTQLSPQGNVLAVGSNSPTSPAVAVRGANEIWVSYDRISTDSSGRAVVREAINATGGQLSVPILVNWEEAGNQMTPFATRLDNDDLLVGWQSGSQDGSGQGVFYRILD